MASSKDSSTDLGCASGVADGGTIPNDRILPLGSLRRSGCARTSAADKRERPGSNLPGRSCYALRLFRRRVLRCQSAATARVSLSFTIALSSFTRSRFGWLPSSVLSKILSPSTCTVSTPLSPGVSEIATSVPPVRRTRWPSRPPQHDTLRERNRLYLRSACLPSPFEHLLRATFSLC